MPYFLIRKPLNNLSKVSEEKGNRATHPVTGQPNKPHAGIDLVPGLGEGGLDVYAAHNGTVVFSGQQFAKDKNKNLILDENGKPKLGGYGNYIIVQSDDGSGKQTLYAHLDQILVSVGQPIGVGEGKVTKIGIAGTTGGSTGVHLHFEVIASDKKTRENPRQYLAEAFPNDFTTTVNAGVLQGDLYGDQRENTMVGNAKPNYMHGLAGKDTYYFPSLSGSDIIDDLDKDGKIVINGIEIRGNALPKTISRSLQLFSMYQNTQLNQKSFELQKA